MMEGSDLVGKIFNGEFSNVSDESSGDEFTATSPCVVNLSRTTSERENTSSTSPVSNASTSSKNASNARCIYLITYSQADAVKVPSRQAFADIICAEFQQPVDGKQQIVSKWACAAEIHPNTSGFHYHLCIHLNRQRRFKQVAMNLNLKHGICVDFKPWVTTYYDAFSYVTKLDAHYCISDGHPDLDNGRPRTTTAIMAKSKRSLTDAADGPTHSSLAPVKKTPRMDNSQVSKLIVKHEIKTQDELAYLAKQQAKEGKDDLNRWMLTHNRSSREELIHTTWLVENAQDKRARKKKSRMEILTDALDQECSTDTESGNKCNGTWLPAALEVLRLNNVERDYFASLVKNALKYGRRKKNNIMIVGSTNCAKSFMFLPLEEIFDVFETPSKSSFNFVGALDKEVLFFNDMRYRGNGVGDKEFMPWSQLLNLLEGAAMNIAMPKNHFAQDVQWKKRPPIFATSEYRITRIMNGQMDVGETAQMDQRWVYIDFKYDFSGRCNYDLVPCARCFARLILGNDEAQE